MVSINRFPTATASVTSTAIPTSTADPTATAGPTNTSGVTTSKNTFVYTSKAPGTPSAPSTAGVTGSTGATGTVEAAGTPDASTSAEFYKDELAKFKEKALAKTLDHAKWDFSELNQYPSVDEYFKTHPKTSIAASVWVNNVEYRATKDSSGNIISKQLQTKTDWISAKKQEYDDLINGYASYVLNKINETGDLRDSLASEYFNYIANF